MVSLHELIDHYTTSYSHTPSALGAQLEGLSSETSPSSALSSDSIEEIQSMLHLAEVYRCADALLALGPPVQGKWGCIYPALAKARDAARSEGKYLPMGYLVVDLLRAYQKFGVRDPNRGLMHVYWALNSYCQKAYPLPEFGQGTELMVKQPKLAAVASSAYADALLAAAKHAERWNARG